MTTKTLTAALRTGDTFTDGLGRELKVLDHQFLDAGKIVRLKIERDGKSWPIDLRV